MEQFSHGPQWVQLSALNSLLRSTGAPPEEPLFQVPPSFFFLFFSINVFQHLQELMQRTRHRNATALPRQRYMFPGSVFNVQGVEVTPVARFLFVDLIMCRLYRLWVDCVDC